MSDCFCFVKNISQELENFGKMVTDWPWSVAMNVFLEFFLIKYCSNYVTATSYNLHSTAR
jgi:hypothetical protein